MVRLLDSEMQSFSQLGNEQNNIDSYIKNRTFTEIMLGMRMHVEKYFSDPNSRHDPKIFKKSSNYLFKKFPERWKLNPVFEEAMKKEVLESQQIPWEAKNIHWSHWTLATSSDALWSQLQRVMEAKNKGLLDEQEDQAVDEMETTTATVGDSRRSSRQRKRPSASKAELNLNEISGSSRDVTKAPIYSETLPKGFYENWAPLTDSQTENLRTLVGKLIGPNADAG
ncbi:hypothetical protein CYMTET_33052 [Cymbomonas tetramitiformis]|uniref:Uncharacterized protein n=1 Tax=Cymbomonas tetramitiformis TaxID=36881 RepID=A0AAE0FDN7_9CHLO|nr:hypothetical protein CYMTET_33052 [Cymbomonas tetramitiformis]